MHARVDELFMWGRDFPQGGRQASERNDRRLVSLDPDSDVNNGLRVIDLSNPLGVGTTGAVGQVCRHVDPSAYL